VWLLPGPPGMRGVVSGARLLRGRLRGRLGPLGAGGGWGRRPAPAGRGVPPVRRTVGAGPGRGRRPDTPGGSPAVVVVVGRAADMSGGRAVDAHALSRLGLDIARLTAPAAPHWPGGGVTGTDRELPVGWH
jgi:hypothetical protein